MGLLDMLFAGPRIEEAKMAYFGKWLMDTSSDELQDRAVDIVKHRFASDWNGKEFDRLTDREKNLAMNRLASAGDRAFFAMIGMAFAEIGVDHGLKGFQYSWVKNPLIIEAYGDAVWETAESIMSKKVGRKIGFIAKKDEHTD